MTLQEQNTRIVAAYRKMPDEGRDALDRMVGKLAEVHLTAVWHSSLKPGRNDKYANRRGL
jgi:hypothetical protein